MPKIEKFFISNYKGIDDIEIDLAGKTTGPVLTLIGLNESGKTTILEALSHFITGDKAVSELFEGPKATAPALSLIPMHRKAAFTGTITVGAHIALSDEDVNEIKKKLLTEKQHLDATSINKSFKIYKELTFLDSKLTKTTNIWNLHIKTKPIKGKLFTSYKRPKSGDEKPDLWLMTIKTIESKLPRVSYFPTFLVEMPARIYLSEHEGETAINRHYRFVFQDVLDSLNEGLSLEKHVNSRIKDFKSNEKNITWLSMLFGSPNKGPIDSVFQKISHTITKEVLGSWRRVFQRTISAKSITVDWNVDSEKDDLPYASFHISDGESRYAIDQRSLGFRWFFSFLLFTGFKKAKDRATIFIFDEPAANLHAKAQAELLTSFSRIATDGNKIIYSTHSHHMVNPRWLGAAYIVENTALDYDSSGDFDFEVKPTKITATPYRQFVSSFPSRSSYFQPVIEKLEYIPPEIVGSEPYLIVEGISDYYVLTLAKKITKTDLSFTIIPGAGSTSGGALISQLIGRGQEFAILLDDDDEGRNAAKKFQDEWFLSASEVITLGSIKNSFSGKAIEKILDEPTINMIMVHSKLTNKPTKKQIGWYFAEQCAAHMPIEDAVSRSTAAELKSILDHFQQHFVSKTTK